MSHAELVALPLTVDVETAGRAFGIAPTTAQEWARKGNFPCNVLRLGRFYRVRRADLFDALGVEDDSGDLNDQPVAQVG